MVVPVKEHLADAATRTRRGRLRLATRRRAPVVAVERPVASVHGGLGAATLPSLERIERQRAALEASNEPILLPLSEYSGDPADAPLSGRWRCGRRAWRACARDRAHCSTRSSGNSAPTPSLEFGNNLGVSTSYIAAALDEISSGTLISGDASRDRLAIAMATL